MSEPAAQPFRRIGVVGGGAWGTALASVACRALPPSEVPLSEVLLSEAGEIRLWARNPQVVAGIGLTHENALYLPGIALDPRIRATGNLADLAWAELLLLVMPSQHLRAIAAGLAGIAAPGTPLVVAAKGVECGSNALMAEVLAETLPGHPVAILSGPTFAIEVARDLPTAVTLACKDGDLGRRIVASLGGPCFRPYLSDDPVGCEIGGAVKNVLAIACGIVQGRRLGDNARSALITRGLAEVTRLALALGGRRETLTGLSGLGDLVLTCNAMQSRNFSLGVALGEGRALAEVLAERRSVTEGVASAASVAALAAARGVEMPIVATVDAILHHGAPIEAAIQGLLARPFKPEA